MGAIIKLIIAAIVYLAWVYSGATYQEGLFIALLFLGILFMAPVPFQSKEVREDLLDKERKNRERIEDLQNLRKYEKKEMDHDAKKRQIKKEKSKISAG